MSSVSIILTTKCITTLIRLQSRHQLKQQVTKPTELVTASKGTFHFEISFLFYNKSHVQRIYWFEYSK